MARVSCGRYVGSRTTYRLTNFDHFYFYEPKAPPVEQAVLQHVTNGLALAKLAEFAEHRPLRGAGHKPPTIAKGVGFRAEGGGFRPEVLLSETPSIRHPKLPDPLTPLRAPLCNPIRRYMVDPEFHYFAFNAFGLGAPSNGFYGTLLASKRPPPRHIHAPIFLSEYPLLGTPRPARRSGRARRCRTTTITTLSPTSPSPAATTRCARDARPTSDSMLLGPRGWLSQPKSSETQRSVARLLLHDHPTEHDCGK
eukprot:1176047-Prorocentrum_minimum.AAC.2